MTESSASELVTHVASIPPEPFSQLVPGTRIEEGDIYRNPDDTPSDEWTEVCRAEFGSKVPDTVRSYARLMAPEGYRLLTGNTQIKVRDVVWRTREPRWQTVIKDGNDSEVSTVDALAAIYPRGETTYVARPDVSTPDHVTIPIPPHHRDLAIGESVRRGDRMICAGMDIWETVSELIRGFQVEEPNSQNKFARHCRPISPQSGHWYVDLREGHGTDVPGKASVNPDDLGVIGSTANPFASLEGAQRVIEKAAKKASQPVFGVIWEIRGVPLFAYDIPEPAPVPTARESVQMFAPVPISANQPPKLCEPTKQGGWLADRPKGDLAALDQIDMEKFYVLDPGDSIREGDMFYGAVDDAGDVQSWQKAPYLANVNSLVGTTRLIVRRRAHENRQDLIKSRFDKLITATEQTLAEIRQLRKALDEEN